MLPTELLLHIAEVDPQAFAGIRSIDRNVRDYTNDYMDKYKGNFCNRSGSGIKIWIQGKVQRITKRR